MMPWNYIGVSTGRWQCYKKSSPQRRTSNTEKRLVDLGDNIHVPFNSALWCRCLLLLSALTFSVREIFSTVFKECGYGGGLLLAKNLQFFIQYKLHRLSLACTWSLLIKSRKQCIILDQKICTTQLMGSYPYSSLSRSSQQWLKIPCMVSIV